MSILIADKIAATALEYLKKSNIEFSCHLEITPSELLSIISKYQALIVRSRTKVTREVIANVYKLKVVARAGTGVDNIDLTACRDKKIIVVNSPGANSQAVAEHTVGLMLALLRNYPRTFSSMEEGLWLKKKLTGEELGGKVVGIVGYGNVGKKIHQLVEAFGAKVLIYSRSYHTATFKEVFKKSDIITLHLTLTDKTEGCISSDLLSLVKPTAFLINTSRAKIIDEEALYRVLADKKIAGAALDVFWQEPLEKDSKWRQLDNVILTPHIAASTSQALKRASLSVVKDVTRVLKGKKPKNRVV